VVSALTRINLKTVAILFVTRQRSQSSSYNSKITLASREIELSDLITTLGACLDQNLIFDSHVQSSVNLLTTFLMHFDTTVVHSLMLCLLLLLLLSSNRASIIAILYFMGSQSRTMLNCRECRILLAAMFCMIVHTYFLLIFCLTCIGFSFSIGSTTSN
jgi:hypothetical protein